MVPTFLFPYLYIPLITMYRTLKRKAYGYVVQTA